MGKISLRSLIIKSIRGQQAALEAMAISAEGRMSLEKASIAHPL